MPMTTYIILSGFAVMIASLAGILFTRERASKFLEKNIKTLIAFSAGVFIVITYSLFSESIEHGTSLAVIIASTIVGGAFLELMSHIIPHAHHHHDAASGHTHSRIDARRVLLGDAAHNIGDGIILVPAYLAGPVVGIGTTVAILFHEMVQEIAEYFILREAGYSVRQALLRNFIVSGTIFIGIFAALFFTHTEEFEGPLLAFAAGGFLYIIFRDLLPSVYESIKKSGKFLPFLLVLVLGIAIMYSVTHVVPHEHEEVHTEEVTN